MKVSRILETSLYAEDLEAAEAFYTRVLGLEVHSRFPGRHVFFHSGSGMFLVFNPNQTEREDSPHGCRGRGHVAWAVSREELDGWRQWLEKEGLTLNDFFWPGGGRSLYFSDPAGNSLELTTPELWSIS
jgi:catechol 2,3-dioxygenase-like lactoylglutathione lyase family enzyme